MRSTVNLAVIAPWGMLCGPVNDFFTGFEVCERIFPSAARNVNSICAGGEFF